MTVGTETSGYVRQNADIDLWKGRLPTRGLAFVRVAIAVLLLSNGVLFSWLVASGANYVAAVCTVTVAVPATAFFSIQCARLGLRYVLKPLAADAFAQGMEEAPPLVVPVIVRSCKDVEAIASCVEENLPHLARQQIVFLIDFRDAECVVLPDDAQFLACIEKRLSSYLHRDQVLLLTRQRRYDPVDSIWRGWERKRGKIDEFCRLLRGDRCTSFEQAVPLPLAGQFAFVTIDIDTRIAAGTIDALRIAVDREAAIVTPMLEDICGRQPSLFAYLTRVASKRGTLNPQQNFNQSRLGYDLFYGKGLVIIDRFLERTSGRIAERTVLSHDHLEAMLSGAVAAPDAHIREEIPNSRAQWARRQYRWMRGDLQIVPWILGGGLPLPSRMLLLEVVLNHLLTPCCLLIAGTAFAILPWPLAGPIAVGSLTFLRPSMILVPAVLPLVLFQRGQSFGDALELAWSYVSSEAAAWVLKLIYVPGDACLSVRACLVVAWRLLWSRRNLLEWEDSACPRSRLTDVEKICISTVAMLLGSIAIYLSVASHYHPGVCAGLTLTGVWLIGPVVLPAVPSDVRTGAGATADDRFGPATRRTSHSSR